MTVELGIVAILVIVNRSGRAHCDPGGRDNRSIDFLAR